MTTTVSRRRVLATAGALGVLAGLAASGCTAPGAARSPRAPGPPAPLRIPPLAPSRVDAVGRRVFTLTAAAATSSFRPGVATPTWGFDGPFGGPTLRARRGEQVLVRVTNGLEETTTVHWHGMSLPARADGGPHQPIAPGATWEPTWRIDQPAATLWYHPHPHGATERHVHRGLAGVFLVDDDESDGLGLPHRYGVDDVPLMVTDRTFTPAGAFDEDGRNSHGLLGDILLVNGTVAPYLDVTTTRLRLRLLNVSPARCYRFALDDERPVRLVGTDSGLLPAPREVTSVTLTPGERAEIVVDVTPGRRATLRSLPQDLGAVSGTARSVGADDVFDVLELRPAAVLAPSPSMPAVLARAPALSESVASVTRTFELRDNSINGRRMDMIRIDEVVTAGATEIWEVTNGHSRPHNLHVHDARFQVAEADGRVVAPPQRAWKDTVYVPPRTTVRLLVRFGPHTDPEVPYMYDCHLLYHEDQGMMGQFLVVGPGERPDRTLAAPTADTAHDHG